MPETLQVKQNLSAADLYDLRTMTIATDRLLIESLARGRSVLEVGCGTGRVLKWLIDVGGNEIVGVELDGERLDLARMKPELRSSRTKLINANFLEFDWPRRFGLVVFAFNVLAEFLSVRERICALAHAGSLVDRDGRVLVVTHMHNFADFANVSTTRQFVLPTERGVWRANLVCERDQAAQLSRCKIVYRQDATKEEVADSWISALTTRNELLATYCAAGLEIVAEYGDYDGGPVTGASKVLVHLLKVPDDGFFID